MQLGGARAQAQAVDGILYVGQGRQRCAHRSGRLRGAASLAIRARAALVARMPECLHSEPGAAAVAQGNNVPIDPADPRLLGAVIILLVLLTGALLVLQRNRTRTNNRLRIAREREDRLRMALWATGEHYWEYDVGSRVVRLLLVEADAE